MDHRIFSLAVISLIILGGWLLHEKLQSPFDVKIETVLSYGGTEIGDNATNFMLESLNGTDIRLDRFTSQKAVIIHFWSLEAPNELSYLQTVRNFYGDKIEILGISEDANISGLMEFVKKNGIDFAVLPDKTGEVKRAYAVSTLPSTYFIDKRGILADKKEGPLTERELNEKIKILTR